MTADDALCLHSPLPMVPAGFLPRRSASSAFAVSS